MEVLPRGGKESILLLFIVFMLPSVRRSQLKRADAALVVK